MQGLARMNGCDRRKIRVLTNLKVRDFSSGSYGMGGSAISTAIASGRRPIKSTTKKRDPPIRDSAQTSPHASFVGSAPPHLRALRSPRDPHPPALLPIVHATTASWILLRAAGSAVAARKSHSRAGHFGVVFTLPYESFSPSAWL